MKWFTVLSELKMKNKKQTNKNKHIQFPETICFFGVSSWASVILWQAVHSIGKRKEKKGRGEGREREKEGGNRKERERGKREVRGMKEKRKIEELRKIKKNHGMKN